MNFFFGQLSSVLTSDLNQSTHAWLNKTIFSNYSDHISTHCEAGFSLVLVNDPQNLDPNQSAKIHIDENYVCTSDCVLHNKAVLIDQLEISEQSSNEQIIIWAFEKWGKLFADKLDGKFSFVLWHRQTRKLIAARDALGYGNFCYSQNSDSLFFASDLATLLDQPLVDKSVNRKRFYQCFRYSNNPPQQTYFQHCHYCPPSHFVEFDGKISITDYWQLGKKSLQQNDAEELSNCKQYLSLVNAAIENDSTENTQMGLMLSGGFDSSLLAAVIARNNVWKQALTCYSYVFKKHKSCDESEFINQTTTKLNLKSTKINGDKHYVFSDLSERTIFKDFINLDGYAALPEAIFKQANKDAKSLLILGHFGDDLFGGNRYKFADLLLTRDFKSIIKQISNADNIPAAINEFVNFGIRPLLPTAVKSLYRKLIKPKHETNSFAISDKQINNIDNEIKHSTGKLFHQKNLIKLVYYSNTAEGIYYYRKHLYLEHGLRYLMPFYTKNMIDFFWNLPIMQLNKLNNYRWLQRQSLKLVGMHDIAERTTKTEFTELFSTGINEQREQIIQFIRHCKLNDELALPVKLMRKLESNDQIDNPQAGIISQYVLTALWWQAIHDSDESFNQPGSIEVLPENLVYRNKVYGL